MIFLKSEQELRYLRDAGRIVALTHKEIAKAIAPGVTTRELDRIADSFIRRCGAYPAFKGYRGFPGSICTSVNEQVVHGIPGRRRLREGDIVSVDVGAVVNGYYGDAAVTFPVGDPGPGALKLLRVTEEALWQGIRHARHGGYVGDVSHAIQHHVEEHGFSVVRELVGHGIGRSMHEEPQVPNFGEAGRGPRLEKGMTLAIEPMVNMGRFEVETLSDGWTVVTGDRSLSAHFEHTIAVTEGDPEILTML